MREKNTYSRIAWLDRFNKPQVSELRGDLPAAASALMERVRKRLREFDGIREELAWHGDCWHWTLEYHCKHTSEPLALIIPSPSDLQLALRIDRAFAETLPLKRMKRAVREGIELAQEPFDTHWGVWSLSGSSPIEDLMDLVELKLRHLAKMVG